MINCDWAMLCPGISQYQLSQTTKFLAKRGAPEDAVLEISQNRLSWGWHVLYVV